MGEPILSVFPRFRRRSLNKFMMRTIAGYALPLLLCLGAQAATTSTTVTVNATVGIGTGGFAATGTATLTGIGTGTFSATISATAITSTTVTAPFTITLSGGNLTGTLSAPATLLTGASTSGNGTMQFTGGTGSYAGATSSAFEVAGTGSGSILTSLTVSFTGNASITTGGTTGGGTTGGGSTTPTITAGLEFRRATPRTSHRGAFSSSRGRNLCPSGVNVVRHPAPHGLAGWRQDHFHAHGGRRLEPTRSWSTRITRAERANWRACCLRLLRAGNYNVTVTNGSSTSAPVSRNGGAARKFALYHAGQHGHGPRRRSRTYISTWQSI